MFLLNLEGLTIACKTIPEKYKDKPYIYVNDKDFFSNEGEHLKIDVKNKKYYYIKSVFSKKQIVQENKLLKAQLQAQTERSDFIEDCIAEMAGVVYNTEETTT